MDEYRVFNGFLPGFGRLAGCAGHLAANEPSGSVDGWRRDTGVEHIRPDALGKPTKKKF